jgi:peptide/nickel transport system substrate-binding protein
MRLTALTFTLLNVALLGPVSDQALAEPQYAIALHGAPRYGDDLTHFPYADPSALKGGRVTLGLLGSFDSLNPLIVKGVAASGVREFAIESLMARGLDEPFTLYGLLAETIDVASDGKSVTFALNPKAAFSDRKPVTAADVLFSFEILKTKGRPNHRAYFAKVTKAEIVSDRQVRFTFQDAEDRELPLILGLMPVVAKHATSPETFDQTSLAPLTGSGPYTVSRVDPGRSLSYQRNPDYWGRDLGINRGRFNFDEIRFDYFREASVMLEAFKRGGLDLRPEDDPGRWADAYDIPAVREGRILKKEFEIGLPAGLSGLVFNTRRTIFSDPKVRRALITAFDGEWINRTLFNGLYKRNQSVFDRSYLSSIAKPADDAERVLLKPFGAAVRPEIMDGTFNFPVSDGSGQNRANQKTAFALLKDAGYVMKSGALTHEKTGQPLAFEILANSGAQEPLLLAFARSLEPLGIATRVRVVDSAQYQARVTTYDFDMIQNSWPSSLSPGNEQLFRWSSNAAKTPGSYNFAGVANPAADAMIAAMLAAKTEADFVSAVRALDRVLLSGDYVIPLFYVPRQWVAHWARLKHPQKTAVFGYAFDTWWVEEPQ